MKDWKYESKLPMSYARLLWAQAHPVHPPAFLQQQAHGVRELDFATLARRCPVKSAKNRRGEDVTGGNCQVAGRFIDIGFLDHIPHREDVVRGSLGLGNAVA